MSSTGSPTVRRAPPPPTPIVDPLTGYPTQEWWRWFVYLNTVITIVISGETNLLTAPDSGGEISNLQALVASMEAQLALPVVDGPPLPLPSAPYEHGQLEKAKNLGWKIVDAGSVALVAGTVTVNSIYANAQNLVMLTNQAIGGTAGLLSLGTIVANTSFDINSASVADTSTIGWVVFAPIG